MIFHARWRFSQLSGKPPLDVNFRVAAQLARLDTLKLTTNVKPQKTAIRQPA
jgi:hypothetical protein